MKRNETPEILNHLGILDPTIMLPPQPPEDLEDSQISGFLADRSEATAETIRQVLAVSPGIDTNTRMSILMHAPRYLRDVVPSTKDPFGVWVGELNDVYEFRPNSKSTGKPLGVKYVLEFTNERENSRTGKMEKETIRTDWVHTTMPDFHLDQGWLSWLSASIGEIAKAALDKGEKVVCKRHVTTNPQDRTKKDRTIVGIAPYKGADLGLEYGVPLLGGAVDLAPASSGNKGDGGGKPPADVVASLVDEIDPDGELLDDKSYEGLMAALADDDTWEQAVRKALNAALGGGQ